MQAFVWILRLLIVVVLVWFAAKNSQQVEIFGLPGQSWQAPFVFVLLVVFVAGVLIGLLAWVPTVLRMRREVGRLQREADARAAMPAPPPVPERDSPAAPDIHGI